MPMQTSMADVESCPVPSLPELISTEDSEIEFEPVPLGLIARAAEIDG